ncbi:hypothetical protein HDU76_012917, partial [Blyttiomyces sp. JEL0837]
MEVEVCHELIPTGSIISSSLLSDTTVPIRIQNPPTSATRAMSLSSSSSSSSSSSESESESTSAAASASAVNASNLQTITTTQQINASNLQTITTTQQINASNLPTNTPKTNIKNLPNEILFEILYRTPNPKLATLALSNRVAIEAFQTKDRKGHIHITKWKKHSLDHPKTICFCRCGNITYWGRRTEPCDVGCFPCTYDELKGCGWYVKPDQ